MPECTRCRRVPDNKESLYSSVTGSERATPVSSAFGSHIVTEAGKLVSWLEISVYFIAPTKINNKLRHRHIRYTEATIQ